jgi:ribose transport system permease protein
MTATGHYRNVLVLLVVLIVFFSATQKGFFTGANLSNLLTAVAVLSVVAMGQTFVLISGGVDLSVAAVGTLVGIFIAKLLALGIPSGLVVLIAITLGTIIGGIINGGLIGLLGLPFFIITLASSIALTGVVNVWTNTQSYIVTAPAVSAIGTHNLIGIPVCVWLMALVFIVALYLQRRTFFGRSVYAVGGSIVAARLSGIRPSRVLFLVYALCACLASLGGVIGTGRIGAASPQVDASLPLQAAAAVLIGGTALTGGAGGVEGTALGVLFIGVLQNGLSIAGVQSFWQEVVTGVILVAAVLGNRSVSATVMARPRRRPIDERSADSAISA